MLSVPFGQYAGHMAKRSIHSGLVKTLLVLPVEQINIGQFIHRFANDVCVIDKVPILFKFAMFHCNPFLCIFLSENLSNQLSSSPVCYPLDQCNSDQHLHRALVPNSHYSADLIVHFYSEVLQHSSKVSFDQSLEQKSSFNRSLLVPYKNWNRKHGSQ